MLLPSDTTIWWEVWNNDRSVNNSTITEGGDDNGDTLGGDESYVPLTLAPDNWTREQSCTWIMIMMLELLRVSINVNKGVRVIAKVKLMMIVKIYERL